MNPSTGLTITAVIVSLAGLYSIYLNHRKDQLDEEQERETKNLIQATKDATAKIETITGKIDVNVLDNINLTQNIKDLQHLHDRIIKEDIERKQTLQDRELKKSVTDITLLYNSLEYQWNTADKASAERMKIIIRSIHNLLETQEISNDILADNKQVFKFWKSVREKLEPIVTAFTLYNYDQEEANILEGQAIVRNFMHNVPYYLQNRGNTFITKSGEGQFEGWPTY